MCSDVLHRIIIMDDQPYGSCQERLTIFLAGRPGVGPLEGAVLNDQPTDGDRKRPGHIDDRCT
jgi:hypothetical protein